MGSNSGWIVGGISVWGFAVVGGDEGDGVDISVEIGEGDDSCAGVCSDDVVGDVGAMGAGDDVGVESVIDLGSELSAGVSVGSTCETVSCGLTSLDVPDFESPHPPIIRIALSANKNTYLLILLSLVLSNIIRSRINIHNSTSIEYINAHLPYTKVEVTDGLQLSLIGNGNQSPFYRLLKFHSRDLTHPVEFW